MNEVVCLLGFGTNEVLIDAEDLASVAAHQWRLFRARRTSGGDYVYVARKERGKTILLHREIVQAPPGTVVDHLSGVRLDNRRANLRVCSHAQNMQNRKLNIDNTSGFKGVSWSKSNNGWIARCARRHLGTFPTPERAAAAYDHAARARFSHLQGAA